MISISYFFDGKTKKTIPFPTNWKSIVVGPSSRLFQEQKQIQETSPTTYGSWIQFLRTTTRQTLTENKADPNNFFWKHFFKAYLYFVGLVNKSKITPYSDESFLLFLENTLVVNWLALIRQIFVIQRSRYLQYLPDVVPTSVGENGVDLTAIWNLNPNTFTLKDSSHQISELLEFYETYLFFDLDTSRNSASKLNTPYRDNIVLLKSLVEKKDFWTTLNRILKNNLGIKFLFLNNERYDLKNLISSFSHYDSNKTIENFTILATNQFREELTKMIFANKRGIQHGVDTPEKLQKLFDDTKIQLLTRLQVSLETLQKVDPKTINLPINGGQYTIDQLLQARTQLLNDQLDQKVIDQIKPLFSNQIYASDITKVIDQLKKWKEIFAFLTKLATDQKRTSLKINGPDYSFTSLIADVKKQFADFAKDSLDELQKLVEDKITLSQLETAYQESLSSSSTENKSTPKKSTNQNLAIGLGTAGGVVALAGAGGFAYWFVKIRKS